MLPVAHSDNEGREKQAVIKCNIDGVAETSPVNEVQKGERSFGALSQLKIQLTNDPW
jgi:hypothetical protein